MPQEYYRNEVEPPDEPEKSDWARIESGFHELAENELRVLELLARGLTNKAIGEERGIKETTVKQSVVRILRTLGLNRAPGNSIGNERVLLTQVWLNRGRFEQFKNGEGI